METLLESFYDKDVAAGALTPAAAQELIGAFTIKMSELVPVINGTATHLFGGMMSGEAAGVFCCL